MSYDLNKTNGALLYRFIVSESIQMDPAWELINSKYPQNGVVEAYHDVHARGMQAPAVALIGDAIKRKDGEEDESYLERVKSYIMGKVRGLFVYLETALKALPPSLFMGVLPPEDIQEIKSLASKTGSAKYKAGSLMKRLALKAKAFWDMLVSLFPSSGAVSDMLGQVMNSFSWVYDMATSVGYKIIRALGQGLSRMISAFYYGLRGSIAFGYIALGKTLDTVFRATEGTLAMLNNRVVRPIVHAVAFSIAGLNELEMIASAAAARVGQAIKDLTAQVVDQFVAALKKLDSTILRVTSRVLIQAIQVISENAVLRKVFSDAKGVFSALARFLGWAFKVYNIVMIVSSPIELMVMLITGLGKGAIKWVMQKASDYFVPEFGGLLASSGDKDLDQTATLKQAYDEAKKIVGSKSRVPQKGELKRIIKKIDKTTGAREAASRAYFSRIFTRGGPRAFELTRKAASMTTQLVMNEMVDAGVADEIFTLLHGVTVMEFYSQNVLLQEEINKILSRIASATSVAPDGNSTEDDSDTDAKFAREWMMRTKDMYPIGNNVDGKETKLQIADRLVRAILGQQRLGTSDADLQKAIQVLEDGFKKVEAALPAYRKEGVTVSQRRLLDTTTSYVDYKIAFDAINDVLDERDAYKLRVLKFGLFIGTLAVLGAAWWQMAAFEADGIAEFIKKLEEGGMKFDNKQEFLFKLYYTHRKTTRVPTTSEEAFSAISSMIQADLIIPLRKKIELVKDETQYDVIVKDWWDKYGASLGVITPTKNKKDVENIWFASQRQKIPPKAIADAFLEKAESTLLALPQKPLENWKIPESAKNAATLAALAFGNVPVAAGAVGLRIVDWLYHKWQSKLLENAVPGAREALTEVANGSLLSTVNTISTTVSIVTFTVAIVCTILFCICVIIQSVADTVKGYNGVEIAGIIGDIFWRVGSVLWGVWSRLIPMFLMSVFGKWVAEWGFAAGVATSVASLAGFGTGFPSITKYMSSTIVLLTAQVNNVKAKLATAEHDVKELFGYSSEYEAVYNARREQWGLPRIAFAGDVPTKTERRSSRPASTNRSRQSKLRAIEPAPSTPVYQQPTRVKPEPVKEEPRTRRRWQKVSVDKPRSRLVFDFTPPQ